MGKNYTVNDTRQNHSQTTKYTLALLIGMLSLATHTHSRLQILSPVSLQSKYLDGAIKASYANFGYIPYGHSIIGSVYYDEKNPKACSDLTPVNFTLDADGDISPFFNDQYNSIRNCDCLQIPFFIAERGDCSFVRKVRNMENIGVKVAIIIDTDEEDVEEIVMSDDGTGGGLRIPAMLIGKTDGKKLIDFVKRAFKFITSVQELSQIAIMAEFIMEKPDNRELSSQEKKNQDFKEYDAKFGEKVLFTPHYVFWKCPFCEEQYLKNDCYGNGKYCAVEPSNEEIRGREIIQSFYKDKFSNTFIKQCLNDQSKQVFIILEDLRQKCLYNYTYDTLQDRDIWWRYMQHVHRNCYSVINEDCSKSAHQKLGLDFGETQKCVMNSFSSDDWASSNTTNVIIDEEIEYWKQYGSGLYPSVVINNRTYRGQLESLALFNALCAGFSQPPSMCVNLLGSNQPDFIPIEDGVKPGIIVAKSHFQQ